MVTLPRAGVFQSCHLRGSVVVEYGKALAGGAVWVNVAGR